MAMTISGDNGLTFPAGSTQVQAGNYQSMVNRIINGRMEIDQRNAGASVTPTSGQYLVDRWYYFATQTSKFTAQQNAGSVTPPAGFINYQGLTSSSAYSVTSTDSFLFQQIIEGLNAADLGWGTANASTVTLSFWVRSSLTGTFGGAISNSDVSRSYPFSFTISAANTWEQKSITIAGDTSGTWLRTNGIGIRVIFSLGNGSTYTGTAGAWAGSDFRSATGATNIVGTNGATFYITGVDLRVGSYTVVPQDFRAYGTELALCQRYFNKYFFTTGSGPTGFNDSTTKALIFYNYPVTMRATPTVGTTGTAADYLIRFTGNTAALNAVPSLEAANDQQIRFACTVASGLTAGQGVALVGNTASISFSLSSEL